MISSGDMFVFGVFVSVGLALAYGWWVGLISIAVFWWHTKECAKWKP